MDAIRKGLAAICAALFIITMVLALFSFNLEAKAFEPDLYQRVFANENFNERLPVVIGEAFASGEQINGLPLSMQGLTAQGWGAFLRAILPPETLKIMGDQALTSIFAYLNDQSDSASISLVPLKASMQSEASVQAVIRLLQTQPACTLQQIAEITIALMSQQQFALCNPPEQLLGLVTPVIQAQLQLTTAVLPDQITIASSVDAQNDPRNRLKAVRLLMRLSPILPLAFLFFMTIIIVRSLRDWLNWWGASFLTSGLIAASMALIGAPVTSLTLRRILENRMQNYLPRILLEDGHQLASAIVEALLRPVLWQGSILMLIGLGMTLFAFYMSRKKAAIKPIPS